MHDQKETLDCLRQLVNKSVFQSCDREDKNGEQGGDSLLAKLGLPSACDGVLELICPTRSERGKTALAIFSAVIFRSVPAFRSMSASCTVPESQADNQECQSTTLWVMSKDQIYVPAIAALTEGCRDSLWVFPKSTQETLYACELAARCRGVAVVIADVPRVGNTALRRIQLATEMAGTLSILWRPTSTERDASWANAKLRVAFHAPDLNQASGRAELLSYRPRLKVDVLYQKGLVEPRSYLLSWDNLDDSLPVVSELASSTVAKRTESTWSAQEQRASRTGAWRRRRLKRVG